MSVACIWGVLPAFRALLQTLLGENESVKERIRFLEAIVQDISKEKDNYKAMVSQLTTSKVPVWS